MTTYVFTKDVIKFDRLSDEIVAAGLPAPAAMTHNEELETDNLSLSFTDPLSGEGQATLATVVSSHDAVLTLLEYKRVRQATINARTTELIAEGFVYDSHTFCLCEQMQNCLETAKMQLDDELLQFPFLCCTSDDDVEYSVPNSTVFNELFQEMITTINSWVDSGRALNKQVRDAADKAAVDAIEDNR